MTEPQLTRCKRCGKLEVNFYGRGVCGPCFDIEDNEPEPEGTEGQDRANYSDTQDRENYT